MVIFMKPDDFTLSATDGHDIFVRSWKPSRKKPQGIVQISHGMAEHSARYSDTAEQLCAAGFIVFAHDHRGHGQSIKESTSGHYAQQDGWHLEYSRYQSVSGWSLPSKVVARQQDIKLTFIIKNWKLQ